MNSELRHNITKLLVTRPNEMYLRHFSVVCHWNEGRTDDGCWPGKIHKVPKFNKHSQNYRKHTSLCQGVLGYLLKDKELSLNLGKVILNPCPLWHF